MSGGSAAGRIAGMVLRALGLGLGMMVALPVVLALGALAVGHLAGDCGPGSSGGCEMGAAGLAVYAAIPSFLLGAGWSVVRDLRKR
ncbi:hypothetical protein LL06_23770 [Hoeflea sp. BAL378]|uniref:hypothetical protein n=1 Tax=Hoeflea sp. BAL378 TaxID=1547437 RepID=UPI000513B074|nr:hypothetical protein [Hoeflea sp. BAL378]KGF67185.1 hypothetical protein LL06_23770 [Hoeflea sp. BAL378]